MKSVGILVGLISITVSPWTTYDPINPIKLLFLSICGLSCLAYLILNRKKFKIDRTILSLSTVFIVQTSVSLFFSGSSIVQGFFGNYGRYFGFFTWLMLFIIMLYFSLGQSINFAIQVFFYVGGISYIYSILQYLGKDFAPWDNYYGTIVGFLGNPNFQSSFLGLFFISIFGYLITSLKSKIKSLSLIAVALTLIFLIVVSSSIQGVFVAGVGLGTYILYFLFARRFYRTFWSFFAMGIFSMLLFAAAVIGVGPLAIYLHRGTLAVRGDYWLAALSMAKANLLTGVGPDQFGTWYRFYRHSEALTRINADVTSDSAHNGYLDFAANFGIMSLIAYLLLLVYVIIKIGNFIKSQGKVDYTHAGLVAVFVAFQSQFLISPNQIGLVIWGWVALGALLGYRKMDPDPGQLKLGKKKHLTSQFGAINPYSETASLLIGGLVGLLVAGPIIYSSMQFRVALIKADAVRVIAAADIWPHTDSLLNYSARLLFSNNLQEQGNTLVNSGLKEFPNSYVLWRTRLQYRWITEDQQNEARAQLHRLDPLNPEWAPKS